MNSKDTRTEIFRKRGGWDDTTGKEEVILVLHFINFTAISEDIAESKAREGDMFTGDPIRLRKGNTEGWRKREITG